jgi:hypothetical protein
LAREQEPKASPESATAAMRATAVLAARAARWVPSELYFPDILCNYVPHMDVQVKPGADI